MTSMDVERVRYFERQYLQSADFIAEQAYHRDMRRRHNLAHHTRGIVVGLRLVERANGAHTEVWLEPGMAVDGYGREILVLAPTRLDALLFNRIKAEKYAEVWIGYAETDADLPAPGWEQCDVADAYRRTVESWMLVVDPGSHTHDDVIVDGRALPATAPAPGDPALPIDESVPYQELPDQALNPLWLLRLGTVHWMGSDFGTTDPAVLNEEREYVGAVTAHVLTPAGRLRVRPRESFADPDKQNFASVEGRLRVDGRLTAEKDVWVNSGKVWFNEKLDPEDPKDLPTDPPLWVTRTQGADLKGDVIRVQLGEDKKAEGTALSIGPKDGTKDKAVLAVRADDVVDIDTGTLRLGAQVRQSIDLWRRTTEKPGEAAYGVGVQSGTLYQRSDIQFAWFRGGKHADPAGDPGGGTQQMLLDDVARLVFDSETMRQVLNLRKKTHGVGVQPNTLYFRSPGGFAWYKGGAEAINDGDAGGGVSAMTLNASNLLSVNGSGEFNGTLKAASDIVAGHNANGQVLARHVEGKSAGNDSADDLYLNWINGKDVRVGARFARNSSLHVSGGLFVDGAIDSVLKVKAYPRAYTNAGGGNPTPDVTRKWSVDLQGAFTTVYTAFAVLGGFSLWGNEVAENVVPTMGSWGHAKGDGVIPQHVFARVTSVAGNNIVNGECYCSESDETLEGDNTVFFTVVVLGRYVAP
jgi:hypothetical protein